MEGKTLKSIPLCISSLKSLIGVKPNGDDLLYLKALESALRNYAKAQNVDLEIWTGGKDTLKLDDINGNPVEIYLARDSANNLRLPAPE